MGAKGASARVPILVSPRVRRAMKSGAVVALESALITHGLPYPQNLQVARALEAEIEREGATPATVAVLNGELRVGLTDAELVRLSEDKNSLKLGARDIPTAMITGADGGTTVSATMLAANTAGIVVFATGGIGGVHREPPVDISADLQALAETPMVVVCAGAKAILDLPATLEYLETMSVPVVGFGTEEFPAFYSRESGLPVSVRLDSAEDIAAYWRMHQSLGRRSALLVAAPIPKESAIARKEIEPAIMKTIREGKRRGIRGKALTPFLLERLRQVTGGRSLEANTALLLNNAGLAARIARALGNSRPRKESRA